MIVGEVLRHHGRAVTGISNGNQSVFWLSVDEGFEVVPLTGGFGVDRVVDQDGEVQRSVMAPIRDLDAFFPFKNLHIFFLNRRRSTLKKEDVQVFEGKERVQVADWRHDGPLYLAILIDDSLDAEAASQWNDLKAFIAEQPENTLVAVAYGRNGAAMVVQDFTQDHALAAKALRIPLGNLGAFSSPYLALQDWLKRWPSSAGDHRSSILLISSGIDYFRGGFGSLHPALDSTIQRAQKEHANIMTTYYPGAEQHGHEHLRDFNDRQHVNTTRQ